MVRSLEGVVLENIFSTLKVESRKEHHNYALIRVPDLKQGEYLVKIRGEEQAIEIIVKVHKG